MTVFFNMCNLNVFIPVVETVEIGFQAAEIFAEF